MVPDVCRTVDVLASKPTLGEHRPWSQSGHKTVAPRQIKLLIEMGLSRENPALMRKIWDVSTSLKTAGGFLVKRERFRRRYSVYDQFEESNI
jgi:hypothetical protein